eukprot:TRINITY_DN12706_c0_g1_i1.p1 TRINITY_DN12706_c0_g1~~TRINITY_DN12706_c0_g1_i1.p1  ORF type:complete len:1988 (-),score=424.40 TRINITY_DN12706_c0_g1_i1:49-6012(-)
MPHINMSDTQQRQVLNQRVLTGHKVKMTFYDVYLDLMQKNKEDEKYLKVRMHGKDLRLVWGSLGFFRPEIPQLHKIRMKLLWLTEWSLFENVVLFCIIVNGLVMALPVSYDPDSQPSFLINFHFVFDTLVGVIFFAECAFRIVARGLFFGDAPNGPYLKEAANWLDLMVVMFSILEIIAADVVSGAEAGTLRVLRVFRVFRVIRGITALPKLRLIVTALSRSTHRLMMSFMAIIFTLIILTTAGTNLFGDAYFRRCRLTPSPVNINGTVQWPIDYSQTRFCGGRYKCVPLLDGSPTYCGSPVSLVDGMTDEYDPWSEIFENPSADYGFSGYQTFWAGMSTTFQVVNIDGWANFLNKYMDAKWPETSVIFFTLLMLFGGLVLMNLVLAILWESFDKTVREDSSGSERASEKLQEEVAKLEEKPKITPAIQALPLHTLVKKTTDLEDMIRQSQVYAVLDQESNRSSMGLKNICFSLISNPWWTRFMLFAIVFNAITMSFDGYPAYEDLVKQVLDRVNLFCALIFFIEVVLKIIGIGVSFFEDSGNRFDFVLVMLSLVELFGSGGSSLSALRTARLLRIFRMINMSMNLRILLMVFQKAIAPTIYFSMIVIVFLYCSTLAGLQLFYHADAANPSLNLGFEAFPVGFLTVLSIFAGDGWFATAMEQSHGKENYLVGFFFYLVTFGLGKVILKNLLLGVIAAEFTVSRDNMKQEFRLRLAIAIVKHNKLKELRNAARGNVTVSSDGHVTIVSAEEEEDETEPPPESPRWPNGAYSRLDEQRGKTCGRNMDILKMIYVKCQAAKRLHSSGQIHGMSKSKYKWPQGERHPPDAGLTDVEMMHMQSAMMAPAMKHLAAPPDFEEIEHLAAPPDFEVVRPDVHLQGDVSHFAAPYEALQPETGFGERALASRRLQDLSSRLEPLKLDARQQSVPKPSLPVSSSMQWECHPVWSYQPGNEAEREEPLSFRERYRRVREAAAHRGARRIAPSLFLGEEAPATEAVAPDYEAPLREERQWQESCQHHMAPDAPNVAPRKSVTMAETAEVVGDPDLTAPPENFLEGLTNTQGEEKSDGKTEKQDHKKAKGTQAQMEIFRECARSIVKSPAFEPAVLFCIIASSISLAFESPYMHPQSEGALMTNVIDKFSVLVVTVEMIVRMLVQGLWKKKSECEPGELPGYFRVGWHILDFVVCITGIMYILSESFATGGSSLRVVRALKMLGVLRPLRLIGKASGVRLITEALLSAIPTLINMLFICTLFFYGWALLFVGLLKGALYSCSLDPHGDLMPEIVTKKDCLNAGGEWLNSQSHFDNVFFSLVTLLHMGSGEGWIDVTLNAMASQGIDMQPRSKSRMENMIPIIIFMALTNFFLLNLLIGILVDSYTSTKADFAGQSADTSEERLIRKMQAQVLLNPEMLLPPKRPELQGMFMRPVREHCRQMLEHRVTRTIIFLGIFANAILMTAISPLFGKDMTDLRLYVGSVLLIFFTAELAMKMFVYGYDFFMDKWHAYDLFAIIGSDVGVLVNLFAEQDDKGSFLQILGVFQILRILMLVRYTWFMDSMVNTLYAALPGLINVTSLLGLLIFMYACVGVGLFGTIISSEDVAGFEQLGGGYPLTGNNFHTFGDAVLVLIRCSTGERWHEVMYDIATDKPGCMPGDQSYEGLMNDGPLGCGNWMAYPYFMTYVTLVVFIMTNLIVAVVLDSYQHVHDLLDMEDFMVCVKTLRTKWLEIDPKLNGYMSISNVEGILLHLPQPVGFAKQKRKFLLRQMMHFPVYDNSAIHYRDVVKLVAQRSVQFLLGQLIVRPSTVELDPESLARWNAQFPELPAEPSKNTLLIAHIAIARKAAMYIRKKRWQWKQRGRQGQAALRALKGKALLKGTQLPGEKGEKGEGDDSAHEKSQAELYAQELQLDVPDPDSFNLAQWEAPEPPSPTSMFISQLSPQQSQIQAGHQLSPLSWPPQKLSKYQPDNELRFTQEEHTMWANAAKMARGDQEEQGLRRKH